MARTKKFQGCLIYTPSTNSQQDTSSERGVNRCQEEQMQEVSEGLLVAHNHSLHEGSSYSTHSPLDGSEDGDVVCENVQILDKHGHAKSKRGPTRSKDVWSLPEGHQIIVECNNLGQPVDKGAGILSSWLGTVARNGSLCPLDYDDWRKLMKDYGVPLLNLIKSKFAFPPDHCVDGWLSDSLNHKWREYKNYLKKKCVPKSLEELQPFEIEEKKIQLTVFFKAQNQAALAKSSQQDLLSSLLSILVRPPGTCQVHNHNDGLTSLLQAMGTLPSASHTNNQEQAPRSMTPSFGHFPIDPHINNVDWRGMMNLLGQPIIAPSTNLPVTNTYDGPLSSSPNSC